MSTPRPTPSNPAPGAAAPAPGAAASRSTLIDPRALVRIKNLQLRARAAVEGFIKGIHRSPYHGFSVEFSEYRAYSPGDDPRYLDWKLFARTDRYFIKRFEDETNLRCHLVLDQSRSMGYQSIGYSKYEYARTAAATIAQFLSLQRDAVGLITFDDQIREYLPPRHRPGQLRRLMGMLEQPPEGRATAIGECLEAAAATIRKRGLIVLISDLLAPLARLRQQLGYLASRGHDILILRILDPSELTFPFDRSTTFQDVESKREIYIDPDQARAGYQARFEAHARELERACTGLGIEYQVITTDTELDRVLFHMVRSRLARARSVTRRAAPGSARGGTS